MTILILLFVFVFNTNTDVALPKATKLVYIPSKNDVVYAEMYNKTIEFMKKNEGFRSSWYLDKGYKTIGYGQRQAFYNKVIKDTITKEEGELILKDSFNQHIALIKKLYPKFNRFQRLSMAHLSYNAGILKVKSVIKDNCIIKSKLYSISYHKNRVFEYNLFNYGK